MSGYDNLARISELLKTQDNRITSHPVFIVQQKVRDYGHGYEYADGFEWCNSRDRVTADEKMAKALDKCELNGRTPEDWRKVGYKDRWQFVTACFTEEGCKEFLRVEGHNLNETRIYADSAYRNYEWQAVRNFLMGLTQERIEL